MEDDINAFQRLPETVVFYSAQIYIILIVFSGKNTGHVAFVLAISHHVLLLRVSSL
jgi:hypothetical protein